MPKQCPILMHAYHAAPADISFPTECKGEACAWWSAATEGCGFRDISYQLLEISQVMLQMMQRL